MTQSQFMYALMTELSDLPDEQKYVIMSDYTQFFSDEIAKGRSEEDIISSLEAPEKIAKDYKNGTSLPPEGVRSIYGDTQCSKVTPLSIFKFVCLIPVAAVYLAVTVTLGLVLLLITVMLCVASVCLSVFSFTVASLQTGFILTGIGAIFFTFTFIFLSVSVFKGAVFTVTIFPKFMGRVLKNKSKNKRKAGHSI